MLSFAERCLVAQGLFTATQLLHPNPSLAQRATAAATIEMRTDTEGVDFGPFTRSVYQSVKREWFAVMPPSAEKGDKGIVSIEFRVEQDGKAPNDSLKVISGSGKKEFDDAGLSAIRSVAPFDHLPGQFVQPFIELRMTFYYNTEPPKASGPQ